MRTCRVRPTVTKSTAHHRHRTPVCSAVRGASISSHVYLRNVRRKGYQHRLNAPEELPTQNQACQRAFREEAERRCGLGCMLLTSIVATCLAWSLPCSAATSATSTAGANVGFLTDKEIDERRSKSHFQRAYDGHVSILSNDGKGWMDIKCDLKSPGTLLLRDSKGGVYYLAYSKIKQVDLSDDDVLEVITRDNWERDMRAVKTIDAKDGIEKLELTREGFYQLVSLLEPADQE